jgi:DNA-nicking Smr family endonuclease
VLVVTGKGKPGLVDASGFEREPGVLRRVVPLWLRALELRGLVVGFDEAASTHGGAGAIYVRLRRGARGARRDP